MTERPGISGLSALQEKEKYVILFLQKKVGGICMAEKMAERIAEILKGPNFQTAEKALTDFCGTMDAG